MKEIIAESIACDPRFSLPQTEETWKGALGGWRRPDVQAKFGELPDNLRNPAIDDLLIRVIAERREFYLQEGGLLVWLFKHFNSGNASAGRRLLQQQPQCVLGQRGDPRGLEDGRQAVPRMPMDRAGRRRRLGRLPLAEEDRFNRRTQR